MKLTDSVHLLRIDFDIIPAPGKRIPRFVNVILVLAERITLIDTGVKDSANLISAYLQQQGRDIKEIDTIILSHSHPDHIGSAADIKKRTGCRVLAHNFETDWIENLELQNRERPVPGFFNLAEEPVIVDEPLKNDLSFRPGKDLTLRLIHSPGHSRGSLNILFEEDRILFTADSIPLKNDIPNYEDYHALMQSLEKIRSNPGYDMLLTSWTPPLTRINEMKKLISEGEDYMRSIDRVVKDYYRQADSEPLGNCKRALSKLSLPPFLAGTVVDHAFKSHLG